MKTKHFITVTFLFLFTCIMHAQSATNTIEIHINDVQSEQGTIRIGLYSSEGNFYKKTFKSISVKAEKGSLKATLQNIPHGTYAISLYHDENNNKELDTNFFGIPKEPYGTSNNARGYFGPPSWEDAKFLVSEKTVIQSIKL